MNNWNGILKIEWIEQRDKNNNLIYRDENIYNMMHNDGELFILSNMFIRNSSDISIPNSYYFGLDSRTVLNANDNMETIQLNDYEPTDEFGYNRQSVLSSGQFSIEQVSGNYRVVSPIIAFEANNGGNWGPIRNLFMTNSLGYDGYLMATAALNQPIEVEDGQNISLRMALSLKDCPN